MTYEPLLPDATEADLRAQLLSERDRSSRLFFEKLDAEHMEATALAELQRVRNSGTVRLAFALAAALRSPRALVGLPRSLWEISKHLKSRSPSANPAPSAISLFGGGLTGAINDVPLREPEPAPQDVHDLRIAAILDEFTHECFAPECEVTNLPLRGFEEILDALRPHMLLVESAWRGLGEEWRNRIHPVSGALMHLLGCCRRRGIPTVFWNKEDPSHFDHFIDAAGLFDHVFTTDEKCVPRYMEVLGHGRVGVLGFACQPAIHNPLEEAERRGAVATFAGSWYAQYPERAHDFERLVDVVGHVMPVEIYDRNTGRGDPAFEYPARYQPMVREGVSYQQVGRIYKSADFAITLNTIKDSPTMLARRVHELLASNTITISNSSAAVDHVYGDRVLMLGRDDPLRVRLQELLCDEDLRHRFRLRGLREAHSRHCVAERLAAIAGSAIGVVPAKPTTVYVVAKFSNRKEFEIATAMFEAQQWKSRVLVLVTDNFEGSPEEKIACAREHDPDVLQDAWVSFWDARDYYGPYYLFDLMLATRYADTDVIGKSTRFVQTDRGVKLHKEFPQYRTGAVLKTRASVVRASSLGIRTIDDLFDWSRCPQEGLYGLAVDQFSYCEGGADVGPECVDVF